MNALTSDPETGKELWRKVHDNQMGGARARSASGATRARDHVEQGVEVNDEDLKPGPDWAPSIAIQPIEINFGNKPLCSISDAHLTVFNTHASEPLRVLSLTTDSMAFQPKSTPGNLPPFEVPAGGRRKIFVTYAPRTLGMAVGTFMLLTEKGSLLINVRGIGVNSPYQVQPLIGVRLPTGVPYVWRLDVHNPHATPLRIVEAVSADLFVHLALPTEAEYRGDHPRDNATAALDPSIASNVAERAATEAKETNAASDWIGERAAGRSPRGLRTFPRSPWILPPGATRTVLMLRMSVEKPGHFEASIRIKMNHSDAMVGGASESGEDRSVDIRIPVQLTGVHASVFRSPDQIDFGVATQRTDRLRRTLSLLNAGGDPVEILEVTIRPPDPSVRARIAGDGILPANVEVPAVSLTYSGKIEGTRSGNIVIRTSASRDAMVVPYRARVMHGKLSYDADDVSFMSPEGGRRPFPAQTRSPRVTNGFPKPLLVFDAEVVPTDEDDPDACCFEVRGFQRGQVVSPGEYLAPFEVEYAPQSTNAIFTATLRLDTNLTKIEIPVLVYHGQLTCFDAERAATRAAAAAEAAAIVSATVMPAGASSPVVSAKPADESRGSALGKEGGGLTVPCAVSDGKYRERNGTQIMGVIDFGVVSVSNERYRRVAMFNPNPVPLTIQSVVSTVRSVHVTRVEVSGASVSSTISHAVSDAAIRVPAPFRPKPPPEGCLTKEGRMEACKQDFDKTDQSPVVIPPDHIVTVDVRAAPEKEELARMGGMLSFAFDNGRSLVAPVVLRALRGDVLVAGSDGNGDGDGGGEGVVRATIELPPAFPGRPSRALLKLRSTFSETVTVSESVSSSDPAVRAELLSTKLRPNREVAVAEIIFDPSALPRHMAYTGLDRYHGAVGLDIGANAPAPNRRAARATGAFARIFGARGSSEGVEVRKSKSGSAVSAVRMLTTEDVAELRRARDAWETAATAGRADPEASSVAYSATITLQTDAVDEVPVRVATRLVRPKMLLFSADEAGAGTWSADVVDFGSTQLNAKGKRRRVMLVNPFPEETLCVRMMPIVPAAARRRSSSSSSRRDETIAAAEAHLAGEYPIFTGFTLEGGELVPTRGTPPKGSKRSRASNPETSEGSDVACVGPSRSLDLGTIAFAPRQARRYEAHLCVRNNFTTLECATLRGDGDSVRVHVAKKPGGSTVVSDVAFRLPRAGAGANSASDVLTQTIHVSNRGSSTVSVAKPYVGALECGGDGSHAGYYVQPCGSFELAPGASKRLTVVCLPEKAAETAAAPGAWTRLAMEVTSPDGETLSLTAQLRASERFATGAYAAGELDGKSSSWRAVVVASLVAAAGAAWLASPERTRSTDPTIKTDAQAVEAETKTKPSVAAAGATTATAVKANAEEANAAREEAAHAAANAAPQMAPRMAPRDVSPGTPPALASSTSPAAKDSPDSTLDAKDSPPREPSSPVADSGGDSAVAAISAMTAARAERERIEAAREKKEKEKEKEKEEATRRREKEKGAKEKKASEEKSASSSAAASPRLSPSPSPKAPPSPAVSSPKSPSEGKWSGSSSGSSAGGASPTLGGNKTPPAPRDPKSRAATGAGARLTNPDAAGKTVPKPKPRSPTAAAAAVKQPPPHASASHRTSQQTSLPSPRMHAPPPVRTTRPVPASAPASRRLAEGPLSPTAAAAEATATAAGLAVLGSPPPVSRGGVPGGAFGAPGDVSSRGGGDGWLPSPPQQPAFGATAARLTSNASPPPFYPRAPLHGGGGGGGRTSPGMGMGMGMGAGASRAPVSTAFGGGLGLSLLGGGSSGYNMWGAPSAAGGAGGAAPASAFGAASFFGDAAASDGDALEPGSAHARERSGDFDGEWDKNNTDLLGSLGLD